MGYCDRCGYESTCGCSFNHIGLCRGAFDLYVLEIYEPFRVVNSVANVHRGAVEKRRKERIARQKLNRLKNPLDVADMDEFVQLPGTAGVGMLAAQSLDANSEEDRQRFHAYCQTQFALMHKRPGTCALKDLVKRVHSEDDDHEQADACE